MSHSSRDCGTVARLLIPLVFACFALLPTAQAVLPAPDGGYPGGNTAEGTNALFSSTSGVYNTAIGLSALRSDTTGSRNTANGVNALRFNETGISNTAIGTNALLANTASNNTAIGDSALFGNASGSDNTAIGFFAGHNISGNGNVCIGEGVLGVRDVNDTTWIRNVNTTVQPVAAGVDAVTVRLSDGRVGHPVSSRRYKEDIKPMDKASEALYQLKPVTYRYKKDIDSSQSLDYGLFAEDVAKINPELAIRDGNGQIESVRYNAVNAMLLNEFLKEHRKVEEQNRKIEEQEATISQLKSAAAKQEASIAQQQKGMEAIAARLEEQESQIQKVSAQLEVKKPAPRTVLNDQ